MEFFLRFIASFVSPKIPLRGYKNDFSPIFLILFSSKLRDKLVRLTISARGSKTS